MEITQVKVFPVEEDKLKAFVSVVFDDCFMVNDIKIIQGKDGLFLSMPSRRRKNGTYKDIAHPLNVEARQQIESRVLSAYHELMASPAAQPLRGDAEQRNDVRRDAQAVATSAPPQAAVGDKNKTLEEVQELHLRDSFWTVS